MPRNKTVRSKPAARNLTRNAKGLALRRLQQYHTDPKYDDRPRLKSPPARLRRLGVRQVDDEKSNSTSGSVVGGDLTPSDKTLEFIKELTHDSRSGVISPSKRQLKRFLAPELNESPLVKQDGEDISLGNELNPLGRYHTLRCGKCNARFLSFHGYDTHLDRHEGSAVRCWECNLRFKSNKSLEQHKRLRHNKAKMDEVMSGQGFHNLIFIDFSCDKFPEIARHYCDMHHVEAASHINDYACAECERSFPIDSALLLHSKQSHYTPSKFICNHCHHDYASKLVLEKHKENYLSTMKRQLTDTKRHYIESLALMPMCLMESLSRARPLPETNYSYYEKLRGVESVTSSEYATEPPISDDDESESTQS